MRREGTINAENSLTRPGVWLVALAAAFAGCSGSEESTEGDSDTQVTTQPMTSATAASGPTSSSSTATSTGFETSTSASSDASATASEGTSGSTESTGSTGAETTGEAPEGPPTSIYLRYDADGVQHASDLAMTCPPGWSFIGSYLGLATCFVDDGRIATPISEDKSGLSPPEITWSALCPGGSEFTGDDSYAAWCALPGPGTYSRLSADVKGHTYAKDGGAVCPAGSEFLGGHANLAICLHSGPAAFMVVTETPTGLVYPDDVAEIGQLCPPGWEALGAFQNPTAACFRSMYTVTAYLSVDVDGFGHDAGPETCPPDWEYFGRYAHYAVCGRPTPQIVVILSHNTEGKDGEALGDEGLVCPPKWTFVGFQDGTPVCLSP